MITSAEYIAHYRRLAALVRLVASEVELERHLRLQLPPGVHNLPTLPDSVTIFARPEGDVAAWLQGLRAAGHLEVSE